MKRGVEDEDAGRNLQAKHDADAQPQPQNTDSLMAEDIGEFEDPYGDDFELDGEIIELDDNDDNGADIDTAMAEEETEATEEIYLPHRLKPLGPDEVMEADPSVYDMLHNINLPWPCLTVDIIPDKLGDERRTYPATVYCATATQALKAKDNEVILLKALLLAKTREDDEDDENQEESDDDNDDDSDPILDLEVIPLRATLNRLRVSPHASETGEYLTAVMLELGEVNIYDVAAQMRAFDTPGLVIPKQAKRPVHTVRNHGNVEGYGVDWSPLVATGALLLGDCSGRIYHTFRSPNGLWTTDKTPFEALLALIEDIQWSPQEATVFATAGTDGMIRIWDTRSKKHAPALLVTASKTDVNVLLWCPKITHLMALGHDDGTWGVWDLRQFGLGPTPAPVAHYDFHQAPVTSIAFNPLDELVVAVGSEDNTVTLWDLSVEADDEEISQQRAALKLLQDIPPQLLFVHWQPQVKEVRWHKQIPGVLVLTGTDGLNIWKTISV